MISTLGSGAIVVQAAIAVTVSAIRLFPMVVSVLPMMRTPANQTAASRSGRAFHRRHAVGRVFRFLPQVPRERRIAFIQGLGCGLVCVCLVANTIGYLLAANLSPLLAAAILMLTPLAFLFSTARNCRELADVVALVLGLALFPLATMLNSGVDILVSGVVAGTIAYGVHRVRAVHEQFIGDWHALAVLFVAGVIPNQIWRMLGLWFGGGIDEGSELLVWVRAVATAILAGVIAQIVVQPPGALASVPDCLRYGAVAAGFTVFLLSQTRSFAGVVAAKSSCWPANGGSADCSRRAIRYCQAEKNAADRS